MISIVSRTPVLVLVAALLGIFSRPTLCQEPSGLSMAVAMERVLVEAIARAERSVVAIARVRKETPEDNFGLEFRPDPFGRTPMALAQPKPTDPDFIPNEFGTGIVVDRRGLILTAYHVLGDNSEYYVTTHDRKVYRAWIKGADPRSDLAVLAIEATDLKPIEMGDASGLRKGHIVVNLGNPYAIARDGQVSASWGIVANLARKAPITAEESELSSKSTLHHFGTLIQTDAKLNLGTSGGALLNLQGEMVGLTTSLAATAGYEQAAGYAYPVDAMFRRVLETLKQGREVEYGYLGVQPGNLGHQEVLHGLGGTRVHEVLPGTPAARDGVESGDVITAVDDTSVHDAESLVLAVGRLPVETVVHLDVLRNDRPMKLDVTLGKFPVRGRKIVTTPAPSWRGMRIDYRTAVLDPRDHGFFDLSRQDSETVAVVEVEEGSPSWEAGFRPNDLICHVERKAVGTPREFHAAVSSQSGPVRLTVTGNDRDETIRVVPPE